MLRLPGSPIGGLILAAWVVMLLLLLQIQCSTGAIKDDEIERNFSRNDCDIRNLTARPEEYEACKLYDKFHDKWNLDYNQTTLKGTNDCNWNGTRSAIGFLQVFFFEDKELKEEHFWKHRMNMHRFRRFMKSQGFLENPGSIHFRTHNEKTLKLFCGNKEEKKTKKGDDGYKWSAKGTADDKDWNSDPPTTKRYAVFKAAPSYLYSQRYTCKKKGCTHHIYVITRPYPDVTQHITIYEGGAGSLTCSVRNCLYDDSSDGCKDFTPGKPPKFFPPVEFYFVFPRHPKIEVRENADIKALKVRGSKELDFPRTKVKFGGNSSFNVTAVAGGPKTVWYYRRATIEFEKVDKNLHDGMYECVFVDYNGVTSSSPARKNVKMDGIRHVHVRKTWWIYVAISIVCAIPIFSLIIEFCAPNRLEHEDGRLYTKAELEYSKHIKQEDAKEAVVRETAEHEVSEIRLDNKEVKAAPSKVSKQSVRTNVIEQ